jgi:hypothetical protein
LDQLKKRPKAQFIRLVFGREVFFALTAKQLDKGRLNCPDRFVVDAFFDGSPAGYPWGTRECQSGIAIFAVSAKKSGLNRDFAAKEIMYNSRGNVRIGGSYRNPVCH